ncbi:MAG: 16S rRNA (uracil(1498)-N(3))-methyltransferase [Clostridiales bacterium]|nr:16S rRNA (uracil(1498)-N(3))-methyltransferase [Clostridiales bacterium]
MKNFFIKNKNVIENKIFIQNSDAFHISKVLKLKLGEVICVRDEYFTYEAMLCKINTNECIAKIIKKIDKQSSNIKIILYQSIPKHHKMDLIVQKSVELGVYKIFPIITQRIITKITDENKFKKISRWQKIAAEAAKQCNRDNLLTIENIINFYEALKNMENNQLTIMLFEKIGKSGINNLKAVLKDHPKLNNFGIIVGPEGGFTESEANFAKEKDVHLVGLGKRILRTETAAIIATAIIMYEKNEI